MDDILESYRILDIGPNASLEEVKRAYRELARVWHPDRFPNDVRLQEKAQEKLKQINIAYERICGRGTYEPRRPTTSRTRPTSQHAQQSSPPPQSTPPRRQSPQPVSAKPKSVSWFPRMLYLGIGIIGISFALGKAALEHAVRQRPQTQQQRDAQQPSSGETSKLYELTASEREQYHDMIQTAPPPSESTEYRPRETLDENIRRADQGAKRDCLLGFEVVNAKPDLAWQICTERDEAYQKEQNENLRTCGHLVCP